MAVAAAALTVAAPARAVNFTFDLNGTGTAAGGSNYGNSRTYQLSSGSGANKVTVNMKATAWSWNGTTLRNAYLGKYDQGLGVTNRNEGTGGNNTHTVDDQSGVDFILFQFDKNVQLTGVTANAFSLGGHLDNDLTFGRSVNAGGSSWNSVPTGWDGKSVSNMASLFQAQYNLYSHMTGNTLDAARVLDPAWSNKVTGKVWMISASLKNDNKVDAFKLDNLKINTNNSMILLGPVPEPATWAMLISGFGLIGGTLRRRRAMATPARI